MDELVNFLVAAGLVVAFMYGLSILKRKTGRSRWIAVMTPLEDLLGGSIHVDSLWQPMAEIRIAGTWQGRRVEVRCHSIIQEHRPDGRQLIFDVELDPRVEPEPVFVVSHQLLAAHTIRYRNRVRRVLPGGRQVYDYGLGPTRFGRLFFERELDDMVRIAERFEAEQGVAVAGPDHG